MNKVFINESELNELKNELNELRKEVIELKEENRLLKQNTKKTGRKRREFDESELQTIKFYRLQNKSIRDLAALYECSVGLMHKIIKEHNL